MKFTVESFRAQSDPKPLHFRPAFLAEQLPIYLAERGIADIATADLLQNENACA